MKSSERELDEKFLSSRQERLRLEIAAERFFQTDKNSEMYGKYLEYLRRRFRPAMEMLMKAKSTEKAQTLFSLARPERKQLDELLKMAQKYGHTEMFLWLLSQKEEMYGFQGKEMEL